MVMHTLIFLCLFSLPNVLFVFVSFYVGTKTRDLLRVGGLLFSKRRALFLCVFGKERSSAEDKKRHRRLSWCALLGECFILRRARVSTVCFEAFSNVCKLSRPFFVFFRLIFFVRSSLFFFLPFFFLLFFLLFWTTHKKKAKKKEMMF